MHPLTRVNDFNVILLERFDGSSHALRWEAYTASRGASGFPGPKCFKRTRGSVVLWFSIRNSDATAALTNNSSWVICPKRISVGVSTYSFPIRPRPWVKINP